MRSMESTQHVRNKGDYHCRDKKSAVQGEFYEDLPASVDVHHLFHVISVHSHGFSHWKFHTRFTLSIAGTLMNVDDCSRLFVNR